MVKRWVVAVTFLALVAALGVFALPTGADPSGPRLATSRLFQGASAPATLDGVYPPAQEWGGRLPSARDDEVGPPPRPIKIKLEGTITQIDQSAPGSSYLIFVDATQLSVTPDTVIMPEGSKLEVGRMVVVNATLVDVIPVATYIYVRSEEANIPIEFRGQISSLSADQNGLAPQSDADPPQQWIIAGKRVEVSKATVTGIPAVGHYAHVKGWLLPYSKVQATAIRVWDPAVVAALFELEGIIEEMATERPAIWRIDGLSGIVDEKTEIVGTPTVGAIAEVSGHRGDDGTLTFTAIRVVGKDDEVREQGLIEALELVHTDGRADGHIVVSGRRFEIDALTFIDESQGRAAVGMWAEVTARREVAGVLYALQIRVERPE